MNDDNRHRTEGEPPCTGPRRRAGGAGLALSLALGLGAAGADDTEIYFSRAASSNGIDPNVVFVLDTSGSMSEYDGTSSTRLERMKDALHNIVDSASNVNVGLMRFNGHDGGSAVIWPVSPIDETYCAGPECDGRNVASSVGDDDDDVEELLVSGNPMSLDGYVLSLGEGNGVDQAVGLRFPALEVPQGATIVAATLEFAAHDDSSGSARLEIGAHAIDDAPAFTDEGGNVSDRPSTSTVTWNPGPWTRNERYASADISTVIGEIVGRPGWCGGNAVAIVVEGEGERAAQSRRTVEEADSRAGIDPARAMAPRLNVTYTTEAIPPGGGCTSTEVVARVAAGSDDAEEWLSGKKKAETPYLNSSDLELGEDSYVGGEQAVGIRFATVPVPRDATIRSAEIEFEVDERDTGDVSLRIRAEASGDPQAYRSNVKGDISRRATLSDAVDWNDLPVFEVDEKVVTPDLGALVQSLVERSDWSEGNAMAFRFERTAGSGTRTVESREGESANAPTLRIRYATNIEASAPSGTVTARERLRDVISALDHAGGTPIVDAYYEAALYMRGGAVDYGRQRGADGRLTPTNRVSHPRSWTGGTLERPAGCTDDDLDAEACREERITGPALYDSPMETACQSNHVVLLSDGEAYSNTSAWKVRSMTGAPACLPTGRSYESCGLELSSWLASTDHAPGIEDEQSVTTHTIGFNFSGAWLRSLATAGGGDYYEAEESADLTTALQTILAQAADVETTFVAPGATVNQYNRLTHSDDIYFALFKPALEPRWAGNLKRYTIDGNDADGTLSIVDANGDPAVDESTGFFSSTARSDWSASIDGATVAHGGAASRIDDAVLLGGRKVYTFTGDGPALGGDAEDLTATAHALSEDNGAIDDAMLGLEGLEGSARERASYRRDLLRWSRGLDVLDENEDGDTTELRPHMGDPMHSRPVLVNYNEGGDEGTDGTPHTAVYLSTNEGFLHSIDTGDGDENYAFVPQELLRNLDTFMRDERDDGHPYGLDGTLSVWMDDANGNVAVDDGDTALLYAGMRRGGRNYYALDISDRLTPKLAWVITGGSGDFAELGQSWSRPVPSRVMLDGVARDVVIFGAGYDTAQDEFLENEASRHPTDSVGRGVYIVDARSGERLWAALGPDAPGADATYAAMRYGVPGNVRVVDIDFDGLADQLWFGDTGGQVWRFDIASYHQEDDERAFMDGGVMADLSTSTHGEERRFYYEPDVALIGREGKRSLAISIGSGWRAHPLDTTVEDRFYVLRSHDVHAPPAGLTDPDRQPITEADLVDVDGTDVDPATSEHGWYFDLPETGEKVLGDSITVNNQVIFTTYRPNTTVDACSAAVGGGAMYVLDIIDGSATVDTDGDDDIDDEDRHVELSRGGIPPEPAALITANGPTVLVGPEQPLDVEFDSLTQRSYWLDDGGRRPAAATPVPDPDPAPDPAN